MADNEKFANHTDLVSTIILDNPDKGIQYRFTISEFRDKFYIGVREWYVDFDGEFQPTNNGFNMPYTLHSSARLFSALESTLSKAETLEEVKNECNRIHEESE